MKLIIDVPEMNDTHLDEIQTAVNMKITWTNVQGGLTSTYRFRQGTPTSGLHTHVFSRTTPTSSLGTNMFSQGNPTSSPAKPTSRSFAITSVKRYRGV